MRLFGVAILAALSASSAQAATLITFDDLGPGVSVTGQYAAQGVVFSTRTGAAVYNAATSTYGSIYGMSGGSLMNSRNGGSDRQQFLVMDFTGPVSGLSFLYTNYGSSFTSNNFKAYDGVGTLLQTLTPGASSAYGAELISFSALGIRKLELQQPRSGWAFGVDNVGFTVDPVTSAVPEATTWAMMIAGFGLVGASLRRRSPVVTAN